MQITLRMGKSYVDGTRKKYVRNPYCLCCKKFEKVLVVRSDTRALQGFVRHPRHTVTGCFMYRTATIYVTVA
jgi:hypothetical protein